jgi:Flp pilus assembly protein TadD
VDAFEAALRLDSNQWEAHYDLALALINMEQDAVAEPHLRAALPLAPDSAQVPLYLGQVLVTERRYNAAIPYLRQAQASFPARLALGAALSGSGKYKEALTVLKALTAAYPDSSKAHFTLGNLYAAQEQYQEAADSYGRALQLTPDDDVARLARIKSLLAITQDEESLPVTADYLKRHPDDAEVLYYQGLANRRLGRYPPAEEALLRAAALSPGDYKIQYNLGVAQAKQGKLAEARRHLELAASLKPADADVHFQLSSVLRGLGDSGGAKEHQDVFLKLRDREHQQQRAEFGTHQAEELLAKGDATGAARLYREDLQMDPNNPKTLYDLSLALDKLGDAAGERDALEKAVKLDPQFRLAHNQLGLRYLAGGQMESARKEFLAALATDPQYADALSNLGVLCARQGKNGEAEKLFRQAVEDDPKYVKARVNLALILAAQGRMADAEKEISAAVALAPEDGTARTALAAIRSQRTRP